MKPEKILKVETSVQIIEVIKADKLSEYDVLMLTPRASVSDLENKPENRKTNYLYIKNETLLMSFLALLLKTVKNNHQTILNSQEKIDKKKLVEWIINSTAGSGMEAITQAGFMRISIFGLSETDVTFMLEQLN